MAIKIISPVQDIPCNFLKVLIYGEPSIGKSSLAQTMPRALLLDADNGIGRTNKLRRSNSMKINSFDDVKELIFSPEGQTILSNTDTIIIDTVEKLLQYIVKYIADNESTIFKAKYNGLFDRNQNKLTLQGYGVLKGQFSILLSQLVLLEKDIIMIAHDSNKDEIVRPLITGSSADLINSECDLIGFYGMRNGNRIIDFTKSDYYPCNKSPYNFNPIPVPYLIGHEHDFFLYNILQTAKETIGKANKEMVDDVNKIEELRLFINNCETCDDFDLLLDKIMEQPVYIKTQVRDFYSNKLKEKNICFDKTTNLHKPC